MMNTNCDNNVTSMFHVIVSEQGCQESYCSNPPLPVSSLLSDSLPCEFACDVTVQSPRVHTCVM
jgi:hypothetical protein